MHCQSNKIERICLMCGSAFCARRRSVALGEGKYCSRDCAAQGLRRDQIARFWEQVDTSDGPDTCWPWTGNVVQGVGSIRVGARTWRTNRLAWTLAFGELPQRQPVSAVCGNDLCCNPTHLRSKIAPRHGVGEALCRCGCGVPTPIATRTRHNIGHVKGEHVAFVPGHNGTKQELRWCRGCHDELPRDHFDALYKRSGARGGVRQHCRACRERFRNRNTPEAVGARFWSKVDKSGGPNACWIWRGYCYPNGYGGFGVGGRNHPAHRVAWALTHGSIPEGMWVLHDCPDGDNPRCVNPSHFFLGLGPDNVADRVAKGRTRTGHLYGEDHPLAKLTEDAVREIRNAGNDWEVTVRMAEKHGVYPQTIREVQRGKTWRHIPREPHHQVWPGKPKIPAETKDMIRKRYAEGGLTYRALGEEFGMGMTTVYGIVNGHR